MENALDPAASAKRKEYARILGMTSETGFAPSNVDKATPKGKAKGGISEGPISGYSETLHGREAVIPLPDNRGIPVQLDTGGINTQLAQQSNILTDILTAMKENNKYTSGILQQGY